MKRFLIFSFLLLFLSTQVCKAQWKSLAAVPLKARHMVSDELGNVYLILLDNTLIRYDNNGDSTGFFKSVLDGPITLIDPRNPLNVLIYYADYHKIILLDRMLSPKLELDLRKKMAYAASAICMSADGNIWVFDPFDSRLKKFNEQLEDVIEPNDLRQQLDVVVHPSDMLEYRRKLYLSDTTEGLFIFDNYGTLIKHLPIAGLKQWQIADQRLLYSKGEKWMSYDIRSSLEQVIDIPTIKEPIHEILLLGDRIAILTSHHFYLYGVQETKGD